MAKAQKAPLVNMEEDVAEGPSVNELKRIKKMADLQRELEKEILEEVSKLEALNVKYKKLVEEQLPVLFDEIGISEVKLDDGTTVFIDTDVVANIKDENKLAAFTWLRKNKLASLIKNEVKVAFGKGEDKKATQIYTLLLKKGVNVTQKESVHPQTLKAFVNEWLENGKELPATIDIHRIRKCKLKAPKVSKKSILA